MKPRTTVGHHILLAFADSPTERSQSQHPSATHKKNEGSDHDNCRRVETTETKRKGQQTRYL